jgi:hypothetical protein
MVTPKFKVFDLHAKKWNANFSEKQWETLQAIYEPEELKEEYSLDILESNESWRVVQYTGLNYADGKGVFGGDIFKDKNECIFKVWQAKGGFLISTPQFPISLLIPDVLACSALADAQNISWFENAKCEYLGNAEESPNLILELVPKLRTFSIG